MNWIRFLAGLCLVVFLPSEGYGQQLRPIVAVFQIQDKGGDLSERLVANLSDYLGTAIAEGGDFQIVPPSDIRKALTSRKKESYR